MPDLHVRVRVAGEEYALAVSDVLEVAELGAITPVPGAPAAVLGVRNLRGAVLPVVDLAAALGLERDKAAQRVVVVGQDRRQAAFAVGAVLGVDELPPAIEEVRSRNLHGGVLVDGTLVGIVDVKALLDSVQEM
jgi:purine-binding chemotaxis protein CheW